MRLSEAVSGKSCWDEEAAEGWRSDSSIGPVILVSKSELKKVTKNKKWNFSNVLETLIEHQNGAIFKKEVKPNI